MDHRSRRVLERLFRRRLIKHPDACPHPPLPISELGLEDKCYPVCFRFASEDAAHCTEFLGLLEFCDHQPQNTK